MKNTKIKDLVYYCDLSSEEELRIWLIGCLLSKCSEELDANEVREIGYLIVQYLQKKIAMDHYFLGRIVPEKYFSGEQKKEAIIQLKTLVKGLKENVE